MRRLAPLPHIGRIAPAAFPAAAPVSVGPLECERIWALGALRIKRRSPTPQLKAFSQPGGDVMREKMTRPSMSGSGLRDKHFTLSLMVLAVVAISMYVLSVALLLDQSVSADGAQSGGTEDAFGEIESEGAAASGEVTSSECVEEMIDPIVVLQYAGHSLAYGGFHLADGMRQMMAEGGACLQEM